MSDRVMASKLGGQGISFTLNDQPVVRAVCAAFAYLAAVRLTTAFILPPLNTPVFCAAAGVAFAFALSSSTVRGLIPTFLGIAIASVVGGVLAHAAAPELFANTCSALVTLALGWWLMRQFSPLDRHCGTLGGMSVFVAAAAPLACVAGAALWTAIRWMTDRTGNTAAQAPGLESAIHRAAADYLGVLLVCPCVLWLLATPVSKRSGWRRFEGVAILSITAVVAAVVYNTQVGGNGGALAKAVLPLPMIVLAAVRLGPAGASAAGLLVASFMAAWTAIGYGPIAALLHPSTDNLLGVQVYLGIITASSLLLAAAAASARRAGALLRAGEGRYRDFVAQSGEGVWRIEHDNPIPISLPPDAQINRFYQDAWVAECNDAMARMYGAPSSQAMVGKRLGDFMVREDPRNIEYLRAFIAAGYRLENAESIERDLSGNIKHFSNSLVAVIENGMLVRAWGTQRDITESRQVQVALEHSEQRLRAIIDSSPYVAIEGYDIEGRVVFWNRAAERIFGYSQEFAKGKTLDQLILSADDARDFEATLKRMADGGEEHGPGQWQFRHADGHAGFVLATLFSIAGPDGALQFICVDVDVSGNVAAEQRHKQLEEQLHRAQKLESLGLMAGGIAHDFNNLLVGVLGNAALAANQIPPDSPAAATLAHVQEAAKQAADLTRQLLACSGKSRVEMQRVDVSALVESVAPLLRAMCRGRATLELSLTPGLPAATADPTQLRQVLSNLVINAAEACEKRECTITIRTGELSVSQEQLSADFALCEARPGRFIVLEVADAGGGVKPEHLEVMFDPFFSTKFAGRGLGLAVVLGIVRAHHGAMSVSSTLGVGTTFRVLFPVALSGAHTAAASVMVEHKAAPVGPSGAAACGRILIVDDEPLVRNVMESILRVWGWAVASVDSAHGALDLIARGETFDAAIVDVTMPGQSGIELAREMRSKRPLLPVLLSSGYSSEGVPDLDNACADGFLSKPFTPESLLNSLLAVIAARAGVTAPRH